MKKFTNPLANLTIASPCSADWSKMTGDERKKFCADCKLNVYNFSEMTKEEAENLIIKTEGRLCARVYKRKDGTIMTKDCPVGWQAVKARIQKRAAVFASLVFGLAASLGITNASGAEQAKIQTLTGRVSSNSVPKQDKNKQNKKGQKKTKSVKKPETKIQPLMGIVAIKEMPKG